MTYVITPASVAIWLTMLSNGHWTRRDLEQIGLTARQIAEVRRYLDGSSAAADCVALAVLVTDAEDGPDAP